jgi:hypothetical protein
MQQVLWFSGFTDNCTFTLNPVKKQVSSFLVVLSAFSEQVPLTCTINFALNLSLPVLP